MRADAEARFKEEAALREAEQERLREVEELRQQLERLLEAERQAKKDEEIVRSLQSRYVTRGFFVGHQMAISWSLEGTVGHYRTLCVTRRHQWSSRMP